MDLKNVFMLKCVIETYINCQLPSEYSISIIKHGVTLDVFTTFDSSPLSFSSIALYLFSG